MIVGFTGSRAGMTAKQIVRVRRELEKQAPDWVAHGDCTGSDAEFDQLAVELGIKRAVYPGHDAYGRSPHRANCDAEMVFATLSYLGRNKAIVDASDMLIAAPSRSETTRSGTWSTVRYAESRKLMVALLILPRGVQRFDSDHPVLRTIEGEGSRSR